MTKLRFISKQRVWMVGALALLLAGCGGGGGDSSSATTPVTITVVDGVIQGATVCLDQNANGLCDTSENPQLTNAQGQATFQVPKAQLGLYPALAIVDVGASDFDSGRVSMRYTMQAPKDAVNLVTPLSTLVQAQVEASGVTTAVAADWVQWILSMRNSPLDDFRSNGDTYAQAIANAVVLATQEQAVLLKTAIGKTTASKALVTQQDIDKLVAQKVLSLSYSLSLRAADSSVATATDAKGRLAALQPQIDSLLASSGIPDAAEAMLAINHIQSSKPSSGFVPGTASAWLTYLFFDAPNQVYASYVASSAAENTVQAGQVKFRSLNYGTYANGDVATWSSVNGPSSGGELHWNGSSWAVCGINNQHSASVPDAQGNSSYNFCDGTERGNTQLKTVDISGQKMLDVYQSMHNQGNTNIQVGANVGDDVTLLGSAVFPMGSTLGLRKSLSTGSSFVYTPSPGRLVSLPDSELAAANSVVCFTSPLPAASNAATLTQLIAAMRGTPCKFGRWTSNDGLYGATLDSGSRNEYWGSTTLFLGVLGNAPTVETKNKATAFYTGNTHIRVAFADGRVAKYFSCQESYLGSAYNCSPLGNGGYVIELLDGRKVMHFTGLPTLLKGAKYWERILVEHDGQVHAGYRDFAVPNNRALLNVVATNALFNQLGMQKTINPSDLLTLTAASYEGTYSGTVAGNTNVGAGTAITGTFTLTLQRGQTPSCSGTSSALMSVSSNGAFACTNVVVTPGSPDSTMATIDFGTTSSGDSFKGTVNYYTGLVTGTWKSLVAAKGTFMGMRQ